MSGLFAGHPKLESILADSSRHHIPVIVLGEYCFGFRTSRLAKTLKVLLKRLEGESFILSPDGNTAERYADIRYQLKSDGNPIPENDIRIAALAQQYKLEIVSCDKHFDYVKGVKRIA